MNSTNKVLFAKYVITRIYRYLRMRVYMFDILSLLCQNHERANFFRHTVRNQKFIHLISLLEK